MHTTRYYPAAIYFVLASVLTLGCEGSAVPPGPTAPTAGTLEVVVSTTGKTIDLDADGYSVWVDPAFELWRVVKIEAVQKRPGIQGDRVMRRHKRTLSQV
jgi:hypothetical protein